MRNRIRASIHRRQTRLTERIVHGFIFSIVLLYVFSALITLIATKQFSVLMFWIIYIVGIIISGHFFMQNEKQYMWLMGIALFWPIAFGMLRHLLGV